MRRLMQQLTTAQGQRRRQHLYPTPWDQLLDPRSPTLCSWILTQKTMGMEAGRGEPLQQPRLQPLPQPQQLWALLASTQSPRSRMAVCTCRMQLHLVEAHLTLCMGFVFS